MTEEYHVTWSIELDADSPEEAAAKALIIQRDDDPANTAVVFHVTNGIGDTYEIDLSEET